MNNRSILQMLLIAALVVAGAAAIGIGAYNAGVAHGIVEAGRVAPPQAGVPYVYGWRPWGFGFFPVFPFFFFLLFLFFVTRGLLWGGPWRGGCGYRRYEGVPPAFEEWHRRAHGEQPSKPAGSNV